MAGRGVYKNRKRRKMFRFYLLVTVIFGVVMFKWGFSSLIKIIAKTGGSDQKVMELGDVVAPQTPVISGLPESTNSGSLRVEGYTEAQVQVEYYVNSKLILDEQTDGAGYFQTILSLDEGNNEIKVIAKDKAENESGSKPIVVIYDFKKPEIRVDSPTNGQEFFGQQNQLIKVSGEVSEPKAELRINNTYVRLDSNGLFDQQIRLNEGENEIILVATDHAGNQVEKIVKVTYLR